jgi:C4-dicarboxylate-specific signal transduction histidine kinase
MPVLAIVSQILIFGLVGGLLGWLTDRQRAQQKRLLANENLSVLGRAAAVVGNEMHDLLSALKKLSHKSSRLNCTELDADFAHEMMRLERMVDVITSFSPSEKAEMISHDLNAIINDHVKQQIESAQMSGVQIRKDLDKNRCPSRVDPAKIRWILDQLLKNAFEVSSPGQTIRIRSQRGGAYCRIEIQDQGPGIRSEHMPNMFAPFFTTKEKGQGLALAGCRKLLRDLGGDIQIKSTFGEGAIFTMLIPRDKTTESLAEDAISEAGRLNKE